MPTYVFVDKTGARHERFMSLQTLERCQCRCVPVRYRVPDLGECWIDVAAQQTVSVSKSTSGAWPMQSDAAGCDPSQVSEQQSMMLEHHGITTEFNKKTGAAIFRDRHHRRKHMEAVGLYDRNGGYGDAMPNPGRHRQE